MTGMKRALGRWVLCLNNEAYPASLERRKIYQAVSDRAASQQGLIRVIDESGDDHLYPEELFATITLPASLRNAVLAVA
jgi:putative heme iron utilization protein